MEALLRIVANAGPNATLVVEQRLVPLLSALAPYSTLTENGVQRLISMPVPPPAVIDASTIIFVATTTPEAVQWIIECSRASIGPEKRLIVAFCPGKTAAAQLLFSEAGVLGDLELEEWPIKLAPDLGLPGMLSLHIDTGRDVELLAARALYALPGGIARFTGFGERARVVYQLLKSLDAERTTELGEADAGTDWFEYNFAHRLPGGSAVDHLILIDRQVDQVTPLWSQATYSGVLSEVFGISASGTVQAEPRISVRGDALYELIASMSFADACTHIHTTAKQLQTDLSQRPSDDLDIQGIRDFVAGLGPLKETQRLVNLHTDLAAAAMRKLEDPALTKAFSLQSQLVDNSLSTTQALVELGDLAFQEAPFEVVSRLLSLICFVKGGIREKQLQQAEDDILRSYGHKHLSYLWKLEQDGLVFSRTSGPTWIQLAKTLRMISEQSDAAAAPYAGLVPLSARLAQHALSPGSSSPPVDVPWFDENADSSAAREAKLRRILLRNTPGHEKPTVMVFFVGGVTYAEAVATKAAVAAAAREHQGRDLNVVIGTTGVISR